MAESISQILRKKYPDGTDIGRLFVESTVKDIECWESGKKPRHTFTQEMLNSAYKELSPDEKRIFNYYGDIHDALIAIYDRNQGYMQQFLNGWNIIKSTLSQIISAETFVREAFREELCAPGKKDAFLSCAEKNLLLFESFAKSEEMKDEAENAESLIRSALADFEACLAYMSELENLYSLDFGKTKEFFISEAETRLSKLDALLEKTGQIRPEIIGFFKIPYGSRLNVKKGGNSSFPEKNPKNPTEQEKNSFVKRHLFHIESIKNGILGGGGEEKEGAEI